MTTRIRDLLVLSGLTALAAHAQLYLLTASPTPDSPGPDTPRYPSLLFRPDGEGGVTGVREIVAQRPGVSWVGVSYDERKAVLITDFVSADEPIRVVVVDFDKADIVKKCDWPPPGGVQNWLAVQPGMGLIFEWHVVGQEPGKDDYLKGMLLDPGVPCEKSMWQPHPEDVRYVVAHGEAGAGGAASEDNLLYIGISTKDPTGAIDTVINNLIPMGYAVPAALRKNLNSARLFVSDRHVFVVSLNGEVVFFRKSDKTWQKWAVPSDVTPMVRGFGRYLAYSEWRIGQRQGETPGKNEWRGEVQGGGLGPPTGQHGGSFPGRLLILDTDTMQQFSIDTKQGDSEVLLVEDGIVYYRAATRLYSAPIKDKSIGAATLLATSEFIRDAHWAFIKP